MIIINDEFWGLLAVSANHPKLLRSDGTYSIGSCDDETKTIYINHSLKGDLLKKVMCHEITHAAMFSYNIDLSYEQEELVADLIATYGEEVVNITNLMFNKIKNGV